MTSAGGPVPAGTLRMVRAMACAYDAHRIHTDGVRGGGTEKGSAMTAMPPNDRFDRFDRFSKLVPRFDHLKWKMAAAGILVGLISGFLVVLYRLGIEYGTDTARWIYARIRETPWLVAPWAVAAIAAALAIAWMVKKEPMAGGSGIPQTNGVVICGLKMRWQTILPVRFIGGLLGSLFGLSLGREGPSIQIGASGAQFLSHRLRGKKREDVQEHYLVTAGAAAGLSAAFSAPLSGMMFALEGVHRSFSPAILMGATAASLTADFVSKYCFGLRPVLDFGTIGQLPLGEYGWLIPLGLVAGLVGSLMNRSLLGFQTLYGKLPAWSRPLIAIALALPIGIWLPDVLGGGSNLIAMADFVLEAAVVGVPDSVWGEKPMAIVSLRPGMKATEDDVIDFLNEHGVKTGKITKWMLPKLVAITNEIPKTSVGKFNKKAVRDTLDRFLSIAKDTSQQQPA